jgi:hypothetical protein
MIACSNAGPSPRSDTPPPQVCTKARTHARTHASGHAHSYTHTHMHMHAHTCTHLHMRMGAATHTRMHHHTRSPAAAHLSPSRMAPQPSSIALNASFASAALRRTKSFSSVRRAWAFWMKKEETHRRLGVAARMGARVHACGAARMHMQSGRTEEQGRK